MKSKTDKNKYNTKLPESVITSKWSYPLESFTSNPKYANPIISGSKDNFNSLLHRAKKITPDNKIIIAHETTLSSAQNIMNSGFNNTNQSFCEIRNNAVFGWIHKTDVGYFENHENPDATCVVLFSADKTNVFVSSYTSSAKQLLLGEIKPSEYENKHVLTYEEYESMIANRPEIIPHLNYSKETLINKPSKTIKKIHS